MELGLEIGWRQALADSAEAKAAEAEEGGSSG